MTGKDSESNKAAPSKDGLKNKAAAESSAQDPAGNESASASPPLVKPEHSGKNDEVKAEVKKPDATSLKRAAKKRRSKKTPDNTECQNCGSILKGDFCHQCGQAAKEPRRLVIGLVQDVFVETLAIDGKLARSITLLLWRPGVLARRFLDGKRVRYSPPFRLYLFASVFFFFAAFWLMDMPENLNLDENTVADPESIAQAREELAAAREEVAESLGDDAPAMIEGVLDQLEASIAEEETEPPEAIESENSGIETTGPDNSSIENAAPTTAPPGGDDSAEAQKTSFKEMKWEDFDYSGPDWLEPHVRKMMESAQRVVDDPRLFYAEMRENLPRFLLLAPVIYGLTLTLLYIYRRKFFVYDHFIVALYMHAAIYAYLLAALLISRAPAINSLWFIPIIWGSVQPLLVLRQAYGSNWFSVWIKWFVSTSIYAIALALIILLGLSFSLYQS